MNDKEISIETFWSTRYEENLNEPKEWLSFSEAYSQFMDGRSDEIPLQLFQRYSCKLVQSTKKKTKMFNERAYKVRRRGNECHNKVSDHSIAVKQ